MAEPAAPAGPLASTAAAKARQKAGFAAFRDRAINAGEPYVIGPAVGPHEIFHALDVPLVTNTWYSSIVAAKRLSGHYFDLMERMGFHADLPRYLSLPMMTTLAADPGRAPWGGLPRPALIFDRLHGDYAGRIATIWARAFGCPTFFLDVPGHAELIPEWWELAQHRWEELYGRHRLDFHQAQIEALAATAQQVTGRRLDREVLAEQMHRINRAGEAVARARDLIAAAPRCPVALPDQLSNVMAITWNRGSEWSVAHAEAYEAEVRARVAAGAAVCPGERVRLLWLNAGLWFDTGFYRRFEASHGAVFVWSMYSNYFSDGYRKYFRGDPMRALAARSIAQNEQLHLPPWMAGWILKQAADFRADGAVMLTPVGDRLSAYGTRACIRALERAGLPVLELQASMVDARLWDEAAMTRAVAEFIETRLGGGRAADPGRDPVAGRGRHPGPAPGRGG